MTCGRRERGGGVVRPPQMTLTPGRRAAYENGEEDIIWQTSKCTCPTMETSNVSRIPTVDPNHSV